MTELMIFIWVIGWLVMIGVGFSQIEKLCKAAEHWLVIVFSVGGFIALLFFAWPVALGAVWDEK